MDTLGKLNSLGIVGKLALHPDGIAVRRIGNSPVDSALTSALQPEVALPRPGGVPVEVEIEAGDAPGDGPGLTVTLTLGLGEVLGDGALLVGELSGVDSLDDGLVEGLELGLGHPVVLDGLELSADLSGLLGGNHDVGEGLERGVGGALDEGVVTGVDAGGDQGSSLGVGSANEDKVGAY